MEERNEILLQAPLHGDDVLPLWAGDRVLFSGDMYVARDATHRRMMDDLESGKDLPFEVSNAVLYYAGPSPTLPGKVVGSIGPTTSSRMDHYLEFFLKRGLRVTIGKGERSKRVKNLLEKYSSIYGIACGGAAAYISQFVTRCQVLAYPELGTQALLRLFVQDFPLVVAYDAHGGDLFESGKIRYRRITLY